MDPDPGGPKHIRILRIQNTVDNIFVSMAIKVPRQPKNSDPDPADL